MTVLDALVLFLNQRFPHWGDCRFNFYPHDRLLVLQCATTAGLNRVQDDFIELQSLDIGLDEIVVLAGDGQPWAVVYMHASMRPSDR
jgi:hypothetical protein